MMAFRSTCRSAHEASFPSAPAPCPGLWRTAPDTTVFDALQLLAHHEVGALVVMQGDALVGVFSERDYTRKVALQGRTRKTFGCRKS